MGSIDLSVGAIALFVGAISVQFLNWSGIGISIILFAVVIGGLLGAINGLIYVFGRIPSFIVTLGTLSMFTGSALEIIHGQAVEFNTPGLGRMSYGHLIPDLPNLALWALISWILVVIAAHRTRFGRYMYLIGGGENVARIAGIPVRRYKIYAFALSGVTAGLGAILAVARLGAAGPTLGQDLLLDSLAAIVVGGTSLSGGVGGPHRTLIGVLIIVFLDDGLNLMSVSPYAQMFIKGFVVIAAVLLNRARSASEVVK
jgi:ribose/xylose/arabinose/galactoside ABC-type transport system permease subunit